jgi:hypothetical protein
MRQFLLFLLIAFADCNTALAASKNLEQLCAEASKAEFPRQDRPSPEEASALAGCSSMDLYFGIGVPADPVRALKCAYAEMDQGDELLWGGSSILMMVYTNAQGAARNFDLAIRLACEKDLAPGGGQENRIEHLARLREENWQGHDFSICDDITSGYWQGNCAWLDERIAGARRESKLKRLTVGWHGSDQKALAALRADFERFLESRVEHEVDASGTARAMFAHQEEGALREGFLAMLNSLEYNRIPHFDAMQWAHANRDLNSVYRQIQSDSEFSYGTVTREGIKKTQRLWLRYRDAWVAFGSHRYPQITPDTWKTWLTRERTRMIKDYLEF